MTELLWASVGRCCGDNGDSDPGTTEVNPYFIYKEVLIDYTNHRHRREVSGDGRSFA